MLPALRRPARCLASYRHASYLQTALLRAASTWAAVPQGPPVRVERSHSLQSRGRRSAPASVAERSLLVPSPLVSQTDG